MRSAVLRRTQSHVIRGSAAQLGQRGLATARPLQGMLNYDEFKRAVEAEELETVIVAFTDLTGRQLGKRYDAEYVLDHYHDFESHACDYLLTIGVDMNPLDGFKAANWQRGYGDFHLVPRMGSLRRAAWLDRTAYLVCDVADRDTHQLLTHAPRTVLSKQVEQAQKDGFGALCASELEYFIYNDTYETAFKKGYKNLQTAGWYSEDYHILQGTRTEELQKAVRYYLKKSGIPVESSKGEFGRGQHELNVAYSDILTMADNHVLYKQCFKEVAEAQGKSVTFMAKPHHDEAGSSCHIHLNLTSAETGKNAFAGDKDLQGIKCSDTFRHFLGGWIKYTPEIMPFLAPTINSYKRYQTASWAPTSLAWSPDNRTAGFRIVGSGKSLRIECRIPGADVNPYLAFAGSLAAGLEGVRKGIEPPPMMSGDAYRAPSSGAKVPETLNEAAHALEESKFARQAFGDDVVDHYAHYYKKEVEAFRKSVTDWEKQRYFEQI